MMMMIEEDDLKKMPYLKAVLLEGLRRHPSAHFLAQYAVTKEGVELGRYAVPKDATVNFMVAEMGWDPRVWYEPMEFWMGRLLTLREEGWFDITRSREIKMMSFGAGRRICLGIGFAIIHLEYLVGNLVMEFEWRSGEGEEVNLSEKQELMVLMKYPLMARLYPRRTLR
ncbi:hypothetical protein Sjap_023959 [Stephania japonica]|uniref:Cytochrome P450 n=1 Tax=Stephania japonica TaxID=461633 RepID=A0AAP0EHC5_9MAGN